MKSTTETLRRAERMAPLLRSILHETQDRSRRIRQLEDQLDQLDAGPGRPIRKIRRVEEELFLQRREFERVEKELARLGCRVDAEHPERIVCSAVDGEVSFEERLDETGYRPRHG